MIRFVLSFLRLYLPAVLAVLWLAGPALAANDPAAMRAAMDALRAGDWEKAAWQGARAGPVGRDVIEWHRLRAGLGDFDALQNFLARRGDWPGLSYLRARSEKSLPIGSRAKEVAAYFQSEAPQTGVGARALAAAYQKLGRTTDAEQQVVLAWIGKDMTAEDETALLQRYGGLLKPYHESRLDMLLWRGQSAAAERMLPRVGEGWQALARARLALREDKGGVDTLIAKVPASLADHPGLAFERFQWRARKGRNADAIDLLLSREGEKDPLGQPERWADWRGTLGRWAMRNGRAEAAYRVAAGHGLTSGSDYAELEWLAGYVALTYLRDPAMALQHFRRFRVAVATPISLGRAGYWEGRAYEAMGNAENALQSYAFGAEFQTSFYGLLAAERAGLPMDPALTGTETYPSWKSAAFVKSSVFEAGALLLDAGETDLGERFLTHLTESLDPVQAGQLADYALSRKDAHLALMISKRAADAGVVLPRAYYPVVDLGVKDPRVPLELALSIARRESEFDPVVVSGAGARGLMQVMPRTAQEVARSLDLTFDSQRLLSDPVYNATIGKAYLASLIDTFGGNMVLVSAAYNAGPSRPEQWIRDWGDPRSGGVDVVDWIEHIPFTETRNYVMRVMESLPVYRARLSGKTGPIRLTEEMQAR